MEEIQASSQKWNEYASRNFSVIADLLRVFFLSFTRSYSGLSNPYRDNLKMLYLAQILRDFEKGKRKK